MLLEGYYKGLIQFSSFKEGKVKNRRTQLNVAAAHYWNIQTGSNRKDRRRGKLVGVHLDLNTSGLHTFSLVTCVSHTGLSHVHQRASMVKVEHND